MKKLFKILAFSFQLGVAQLALRAGAADVFVPLSHWTGAGSATNRSVLITPLALTPAAGTIATYDPLLASSGTNASFWLSNTVAGTYMLEVQAPPSSFKFRILVPQTNGSVTADTIMVADSKSTWPPATVAWSAQASDQRYAAAGSTGGGLGGALDTNTPIRMRGGVIIGTNGDLTGILGGTSSGLSIDNTGRFPIADIDVYAFQGFFELTNFTAGVRATYFWGDGSHMTGLPASGASYADLTAGTNAVLAFARNAVANVWTNGTPANGGALTNLQVTNLVGGRYVVNVLDYGAVSSVGGAVDCTLAISNALVAARLSRLPVYLPSSRSNTYYKVSGTFTIGVGDMLSHVDGGALQNSASAVSIFGDPGTIILQTVDKPVFVFTNGLNFISLKDLRIVSTVGHNASTTPGVAFYVSGSSADNSDNCNLTGLQIEGFRIDLLAESPANMAIQSCSFQDCVYPFWFTSTNATYGTNASQVNSTKFDTCAFTSCDNGGFLLGGNGVLFLNCEAGNPTMTNFLTVDTSSGMKLAIQGGNIEHHNGAIVNVVGPNPPGLWVTENNVGVGSSPGTWNIYSTNQTTTGPRVFIDRTDMGPGSMPSYDCANQHLFSTGSGSTLVVGTNGYAGPFTNYMGGPLSQIDGASLGTVFSGAAAAAYEGRFFARYFYDAKGRSMLSYGAISNWGVENALNAMQNAQVMAYPLLQYNYDKADGLLPFKSTANIFTAANTFTGNVTNSGTVYGDPPAGTPVTLAQTTTANNEDWSSGNQTMVSKLNYGLAIALPQTFRVVVAVGHHGCLLSNVCVKVTPANSAAGTAFSAAITLSNRITFSAATGASISANQWFLTNTASNGGLIYSDPISIPITITNDYWFYAYLPNVAPNNYSGSGSDGTVQYWNAVAARSGTGMSVLFGDMYAGSDLTTASVTPADPSTTKWYLFKALVK